MNTNIKLFIVTWGDPSIPLTRVDGGLIITTLIDRSYEADGLVLIVLNST